MKTRYCVTALNIEESGDWDQQGRVSIPLGELQIVDRPEALDGRFGPGAPKPRYGCACPIRGLRTAVYEVVNAFQWRDGWVDEISVTYRWANGVVCGQARILVGVFPARKQQDRAVYGGSPAVADVLALMNRYGLKQDTAVALMHESDEAFT